MKLKNLGHASYLITADNGTKIITDPFDPEEKQAFKYLKPGVYNESADVITISHGHGSHCYVWSIKGKPILYLGSFQMEFKGVKFNGVASYHDEYQGKKAGTNTIICIEVDGVRVCHLGDLAHKLTAKQLKQIGKVNILLIPVMGMPMMSCELCNVVSSQINAKVVIPIHYWNQPEIPPSPPGSGWTPKFHVKDFLKDKKNVIWMETSDLEYTTDTLPSETQYILPKAKYDILI